jgi:hypothetical protein
MREEMGLQNAGDTVQLHYDDLVADQDSYDLPSGWVRTEALLVDFNGDDLTNETRTGSVVHFTSAPRGLTQEELLPTGTLIPSWGLVEAENPLVLKYYLSPGPTKSGTNAIKMVARINNLRLSAATDTPIGIPESCQELIAIRAAMLARGSKQLSSRETQENALRFEAVWQRVLDRAVDQQELVVGGLTGRSRHQSAFRFGRRST